MKPLNATYAKVFAKDAKKTRKFGFFASLASLRFKGSDSIVSWRSE